MSDATSRPTFTVSSAADVTGKSRRTIGRMLADGELPGAHKTDGAWTIPLESLLAAGLTVNAPSPPDPAPAPPDAAPLPPPAARVDAAELDRVRSEAIEWRRRAEVAEAIAAERAAALEDVRAALAMAQRMLPPVATMALPPPPAEPDPLPPPAQRRRWWRKAT